MNLETLRLIRNILLRTVVVGVLLAIVLCIITMVGWHVGMKMAVHCFHTDAATVTPLVMKFFVDIRFFLLFVLLAPGLAIHWTIKREATRKG